MRKRSGAVKVESYEELLDEVGATQMKHRDQVRCHAAVPDSPGEDALSTLPDEDDEVEVHQPQVTVKLLVTGRPGVGKGALIKQFLDRTFSGDYEATVG